MKLYLTKKEAARCAGVSVRTIDRWRKRGILATHRAGPKLVRIDPDELTAVRTPDRRNEHV